MRCQIKLDFSSVWKLMVSEAIAGIAKKKKQAKSSAKRYVDHN